MSIKDLLPARIGFGSAPLGNMFRNIAGDEASETVQKAWDQGIRYYDTAPFYGAGLAEIRLGEILSAYPRDEYIISTKVGRVILDEVEDVSKRDLGEKGNLFKYGRPNKMVFDYTADATNRSIEDSLKRLKTDRLDIIWVHDVAQDFYGDEWLAKFESARTGAFRVLDKLRDEGVIKGWGLGVNRTEPIEIILSLQEARPDGFLLAGRYSLLDHEHALQRVMPEVARQGLGIVAGGPYNSGILAGGDHFEYGPPSADIIARVEKIRELAEKYAVSVKAAALQFVLANPAVAAVIPGSSKPGRISEDLEAMTAAIPTGFWRELLAEGLLSSAAPLPATNN